MLKYISVLPVFIGLFLPGRALAQSDFLGFGFRAGLSYAKIDGPSETGPDGAALEEFSMANGFHIGATIHFKFTDLVGLRTEFIFSQRGTKYKYDGPSYYVLKNSLGTPLFLYGRRVQLLNVSNAYVDIPLMAYYKLGAFELSGGFNLGLLVASSGGGTSDHYGASSATGRLPDPSPFRVNLNHNYKRDKAGEAPQSTQEVKADDRPYFIPTATGAYYDFETKTKSLYKTLDFGWIFGASYFLNTNLYLGARYVIGTNDMDRNEYDISLQSLNNGALIPRADTNKSRSWQFTLGFSF